MIGVSQSKMVLSD